MSDSRFPDPRRARGDIVAFGDDLRVETLRDAYRHGIFPWPTEDYPLPWFSPRRRAVIMLDELHVGRTLRKSLSRSRFDYSIDRDFAAVIEACSRVPRPEQEGTWIEPRIVAAYTRLHEAGDAHSIEVWEDGKLAGGLYGVDAGGVFTGESMFHLRNDASRAALLYLADHLAKRGATFIDCQVSTPHMVALGAREIARAKYLDLLARAQTSGIVLFD